MRFDLDEPVNVDGIVFQGSFEMTDPYFSARIQEEVEKQKGEEEPEVEAENAPSDSGRSETKGRSTAK